MISGPGPSNSRTRPDVSSVQLYRNTIRWGAGGADGRSVPEPAARWLYLVGDRSVRIDAADLISDPASPRSFSVPSREVLRSSTRNSFSRVTNNDNVTIASDRRSSRP